MTRAHFDQHFTAGTIDQLRTRAAGSGAPLSAAHERALTRADLNHDGVIGNSTSERRAVWTAVDGFDRNGTRGSVSSGTGTGFRAAQGLTSGAPTTPNDPPRTGGSTGAPRGADGGGSTPPTAPTAPTASVAPTAPPDPIEREITANRRNQATLERSTRAIEAWNAAPAERRTPELRAAMQRVVDATMPLAEGVPAPSVGLRDAQGVRLESSVHDQYVAAANFRDAARAGGFIP